MAKSAAPKETKSAAPEKSGFPPLAYDVRIHSIRPEGTLKGTASVSLNGQFAIRSVKIMEGSNGLFVSMPSYKDGKGEYKDICFPCTKEARAAFDSAVMSAYQMALTQKQAEAQNQSAAPEQAAAPRQTQTM
jgi:stage V sporulation protein G